MTKGKGRKWDGKSRVSNELYRKRYNEIFKKTPDPFDVDVEEDKNKITEISLKQFCDDIVDSHPSAKCCSHITETIKTDLKL